MVGICCFFIVIIPLKLRLSFDSRSIRAGVLIIRCQISSISQANMVSRRGEEGGLNTHNYIDTSNNTAAAQYGAIEAAQWPEVPSSHTAHLLII